MCPGGSKKRKASPTGPTHNKLRTLTVDKMFMRASTPAQPTQEGLEDMVIDLTSDQQDLPAQQQQREPILGSAPPGC